MANVVDEQEMLKIKLSGKQKRVRSNIVSSTSLTNENLKLNEILDDENTMVYALVEVSKDSEKSAKREKIPLNNEDFLQVMQKLMISKNDLFERKIVKPSKRKHAAESASFITNISKEEKNIQNDALVYQKFGCADETSVLYQRPNENGIEIRKGKERYRFRRRMLLDDPNGSEIEPPHLKILFNRNHARSQEPKVKQEGISPVSRGTNTDIVQTPKVLEEALQALALNFEMEKSGVKSDGNQSARKNICSMTSERGKDVSKVVSSDIQNLLLVPFIVTNSQVAACRKSESSDSTNKEEQKPLPQEENESVTDRSLASHDSQTQKVSTDKESEVNSVNNDRISRVTFSEIKSDQMVGTQTEEEKQGVKDNRNEWGIVRGLCLLKEVKTLQKRINAIVEGLETKTFTCAHNADDDHTNNGILLSGMPLAEETNHRESAMPDSLEETNPVCLNEETSNIQHCQEFGVQVTILNSSREKMVTVPSVCVVKSLTNKFVQFPSEMEIELMPKPPRLIPSKSSPVFRSNFEFRFVKTKRTSSLQNCRGRIEEAEYLHLTNLNLNCEGSVPDEVDQFEKEEIEMLRKTAANDEPHRTEKSTNILFRKDNLTFLTEIEKNDHLVTVKQCGKAAKIKIIGNATLYNEKQNTGVGKIKLELNDLGNVQISNKFSRKTNPTDNNRICNISNNNNNNNNSADSNSKIPNSNIGNNVKEIEKNKKVTGKETACKIARRETVPKKVGDVAKPTGSNPKTSARDPDSTQPSPGASKLKKPSTPFRMFSRGKKDGSDSAISPRAPIPKDQSNPPKAEEIQSAKSPQLVKNAEKKDESKKSGTPTLKKQPSTPVKSEKKPEEVVEKPSEEIPAKTVAEASEASVQSSPVKSIWALTKVVLYEDGTQSFEVLEASSQPLKYQLNKRNGNKEGKESKTNTKTNDSVCKNNSCSKEKSHRMS